MKLLIRNQKQVLIRHSDFCFAVRRYETKKRLRNRIFGKNSPYAEVPRQIVCSDFSGRIEIIFLSEK